MIPLVIHGGTKKIRKFHGKMICTWRISQNFPLPHLCILGATEESLGPVASDGLALHPDLVVFLQCAGGVTLRCGAASISHLVLRAMVKACW